MFKEYDGLYDLVENDEEADEYFRSLPDYVQETIASRADNICSMRDLETYAGNLLAGDD